MERNALVNRVYPKLKQFCAEHGYEFQVVDMRWNVRDAPTNDHLTSELCLNELRTCQKFSKGPNFVVSTSRLKDQYIQARRQGGARGAHAPPKSQEGPPDGIVKDLK